MVRIFSLYILILFALTSCSSSKPVASTTMVKPVAEHKPLPVAKKEKEVKFLDNISTKPSDAKPVASTTLATPESSEEKGSAIELKYARLLNTDVEMLADLKLLEYVDDWYGTKYLMGGTTKSGIDCSAFVQTIYASAFGVSLPRTAREQFRVSRIISATDLKEGDLLFFNTTGGVSHVGIYLMNNKFVHASSSKGVTVSDVFDPYYLRKYLGAGRIEKPAAISH